MQHPIDAEAPEAPALDTEGDRRGFFSRLGKGLAGAAAFLLLARCDEAPGVDLDDDFGMHGPVRENHAVLQLPEATAALALFAPFTDGRPFLRRWAIAHVARGRRDQIVILLVDTETGGHAELELMALDPDIKPIAQSARYGVFVDNGGRGDEPTPLHLRNLAERLAEIVADNEGQADPGWPVPSLREAARTYEQLMDPMGDPRLGIEPPTLPPGGVTIG